METGALQELFGPAIFKFLKAMAGPPFMSDSAKTYYARSFWCSTAYSIAELRNIEGVQ